MNVQDMKLAKVKKSCKLAKNTAIVFLILTLLAAITAAIGGGICFAMKNTINPILNANLDNMTFDPISINGVLQFRMDLTSMIADGKIAEVIALYCAFGAVVTLFLAWIFAMVTKIFGMLEKSESPFDEQILHSLKKIFLSMTILSGILTGLGTALILGLILWCIYCIMDYGCVLQMEVDDTV